jgi:uncharacterized membrane protein YkgB
MPALGKFLIVFGVIIVAVGLFLLAAPKIPWLGRLPGDILIKKKNFTLYFPIATSIVLSIILTVLINLLRK